MDTSSEKTTSKPSKKAPHMLGIISEIGQVILIIALVAIAVLSFGSKIPALSGLGMRFFTVISGSMEPTIPTGSVIMVDDVETTELKQGDIITFQKFNTETNQNAIITHRIDAIEQYERVQTIKDDQTGEESTQSIQVFDITTKGDANNEVDGAKVLPGEVIGVYQWHIPHLGFLTSFIQSSRGFIMVVVIPTMVLIVWELVSLVLQIREWMEKRKQAKA